MERSNKKKNTKIDRETSSNKMFAMLVIMKVTLITFSKIQTLNMLRKSQFLKLRKTITTYPHLKPTFILKVPPSVVILSYQRRN